VSAARTAQQAWARTPATDRGAALRAMATNLRAHAAELASTLATETGRPPRSGREGVLAGAS
jgi:acyl-CoA reductase-like NAD-dependent aldehyde dehydrogenase